MVKRLEGAQGCLHCCNQGKADRNTERPFHTSILTFFFNMTISNIGQDMEQQGLISTVGESRINTTTLENNLTWSCKNEDREIYMPHDTAILVLGIYSRDTVVLGYQEIIYKNVHCTVCNSKDTGNDTIFISSRMDE